MGRGPIIFRFVFAKCLPPQDAADRLLPPEHAAERALPPQDATKRARGVIVVENDQKKSGFENDQRATTKPQIAQREKEKNMMASALSTRRAGP